MDANGRLVLVVGFDASSFGERAVFDALRAVEPGSGGSILVVSVIDQQGLDATGKLSAETKRAAALERAYPTVWRRVKEIGRGLTFGLPDDVTVHIRFAPVHATRVHEEIARQLLQVAADFDARALVLGRQGRPGGVVEHLHARARLAPGGPIPDEAEALFLAPAGGAFTMAKSDAWSS